MRRLCAALALAATIGCSANPHVQTPRAHASPKQAAEALRQLQSQLTTVFAAPVMARGRWGVHIRSLDRDDTLFALNPDRLMMPASNMKILTLAAAADVLGWDHRFTTSLETSAPIENGVLCGDLVVRGTGDPTINTRDARGQSVFDEWVSALKSTGIMAIDGRIVGDDQAFDEEGIGSGWSWDYLEAGYAAPIGALQYNQNVAELTMAPGAAAGDPIVVRLDRGSGLTVVNLARTGTPAESRLRSAIDVRRRIDGPVLEISGMISIDAPPVTRTVAVVNPTLFFVESLRGALEARGIRVSGPAVDGDDSVPTLAGDSGERRVLATVESPPLREIATVVMKVSQNQYAETLLKAAGAAKGGLGTTSAGREAAAAVFINWGIAEDAYVMADGSGLSRYNYIAPSMLTSVLSRLHEDPRHREPFVASLPVAGQDGTISTRMRRSLAEGNAAAKTGSIANVRSLSGYVTTRNGERLAFAILANDFVIPAATVNWITDLAVEILAAFQR